METLKDDRLIALCAYWSGKRKDAKLPRRADVDPLELRHLLPHLFLIDVVSGTRTPMFRHRLVGTEIVDLLGRDLTGELIDERHYGAHLRWINGILNEVSTRAVPVAQRVNMAWVGRPSREVEIVFLPLAADGSQVNMVLGAMVAVPSAVRPTKPVLRPSAEMLMVNALAIPASSAASQTTATTAMRPAGH